MCEGEGVNRNKRGSEGKLDEVITVLIENRLNGRGNKLDEPQQTGQQIKPCGVGERGIKVLD